MMRLRFLPKRSWYSLKTFIIKIWLLEFFERHPYTQYYVNTIYFNIFNRCIIGWKLCWNIFPVMSILYISKSVPIAQHILPSLPKALWNMLHSEMPALILCTGTFSLYTICAYITSAFSYCNINTNRSHLNLLLTKHWLLVIDI